MKKTATISDVFDTEDVKIVRLKVVNDKSVALFLLGDGADGYGLAFYTENDDGTFLDSVYASYDNRLMDALFDFAIATLNVADAGVVLRQNGLTLGAVFEPYSLSTSVDVLLENGVKKRATKQTSLRDFGPKNDDAKVAPKSHTERSIDRVITPRGEIPQKYSITYESVTDGAVLIVFTIDGAVKDTVRIPKRYADDGWKMLYRRIVEPENTDIIKEEILDGFKKLKFIFAPK